MLLKPPDCSTYPLTPCTEADWVQCNWCHELICEIHSVLYPVLYSGSDPYTEIDLMCSRCIGEAWQMGEILRGETYEYINWR